MKRTFNKLTGAAVLGFLTMTAATVQAADSASTDAPSFHPFTVGVEFGTLGPGVAANWRFADHFGVGTGFDYFSYSLNNKKIKEATYNAKLRMLSAPLTLDWYPWTSSSFHVSAGAVINENHLTGNALATLTLAGVPYTGALNLDIKPQPVDPYLGIGWNVYLTKSHHWSLAGTLGVLYQGNAKVSLTSSPIDPTGNVALEQSQVQKYANDLKFFPVLKLGVNYSF